MANWKITRRGKQGNKRGKILHRGENFPIALVRYIPLVYPGTAQTDVPPGYQQRVEKGQRVNQPKSGSIQGGDELQSQLPDNNKKIKQYFFKQLTKQSCHENKMKNFQEKYQNILHDQSWLRKYG